MNRREFLKLSGHGVLALGLLKTGCVPCWLSRVSSLAEIYGVGEEHLHFDAEGNAYEIKSAEHKVVRLNPDGSVAWEVGGYGTDNGKFNCPVALEVDQLGQVYVVDLGNHRIEVFDSDGEHLRQIGVRGEDDDPSYLDFPRHIHVDREDRLYVCDSLDHHIQVYDHAGNAIARFAEFGTGGHQLNYPLAVEVDPEGNIHVVDAGNARVQIYDPTGRHLRSYGSFGDGLGGLRHPRSLVIDSNGNSYVVDAAGGHIDVFGPHGVALWQFEPTFADGRRAAPLHVTWAPGEQLYITAVPWTPS